MKFIHENMNWFLVAVCWLFAVGIVWLFAEARTPEALKRKRIIGSIAITIWMWAAMFYAAFSTSQPPVFQQHIDPPAHWWKCGNS